MENKLRSKQQQNAQQQRKDIKYNSCFTSIFHISLFTSLVFDIDVFISAYQFSQAYQILLLAIA